MTPQTVEPADLDRMWREELERWGGEDEFARHWERTRTLPHEYLLCDIVNAPESQLSKIKPERNSPRRSDSQFAIRGTRPRLTMWGRSELTAVRFLFLLKTQSFIR